MKVIEYFVDAKTGQSGQREVERPDVISQEEAARREPALESERKREALKLAMREVLVEEALGLDVTERKRELCTAFSALR